MEPNFSIIRLKGLKFQFDSDPSDLEVPEGGSFLWDFGDGSSNSTEKDPVHTYSSVGEYTVYLKTLDSEGIVVETLTQLLTIVTLTKSLSGLKSISKSYVHESLYNGFELKYEILKEKWLLYLQPLVKNVVPLEEFDNEDYYESLEIQLAGELIAFEYLSSESTKNLLASIANNVGELAGGSDTEQEVKKLVTGPTEAEFYSNTESTAKIIKAITDINKPGGVIDGLKISICQLASRLEIYLPMCGLPKNEPRHFLTVKRRK